MTPWVRCCLRSRCNRVLEKVDAACEEAPLVSYLDNMNLVGKLTPAVGAFRRLCVEDESAA